MSDLIGHYRLTQIKKVISKISLVQHYHRVKIVLTPLRQTKIASAAPVTGKFDIFLRLTQWGLVESRLIPTEIFRVI